MLSYISVKNFAIIENIEVAFNKGMTALTGETGAGKSLLIDAIGLLLGDRATSNVVRTGSTKAEVEGVFIFTNPKISKLLNKFEIENEDNQLIIRRQITTSNNNLIKINNRPVTLSQLKEITGLLADIHTQHDTHRLINPQTYIEIIDGFENEKTTYLIEQYLKSLGAYKKELKLLKELKNRNFEMLEKLDLMQYQVKELEAYNLDVLEEETLLKEVEKMENFDHIFQKLNEAKLLVESTNALDNIYSSAKQLEAIEEHSETFKELKQRLLEAYYELEDTFESLKIELNSLDFDPLLLDSHQQRLNSLASLKRKYRKELPELIMYLERIKEDINNIDNYEEIINNQEEKVKDYFVIVKKDALKITDLRRKTSLYIEKELLAILEDLELKKTRFKIVFLKEMDNDYLNDKQFLNNGVDEVDFLLSTNVGEPLKPLSKSASGGEMSRIMLALKSLLVNSLQLSLIIFDEIDSGVSGFVANQVAKKIKEISKTTQVICITHIPQVAAVSNNHLFISKGVEEERTKAHIKELREDERVNEIAQMISGDKVSKASLESAKELLK